MRSLKFYELCVLRRWSKEELHRSELFWEFGKRAEVSGTWKIYMKDCESCIVNFFFTVIFKGLQANFLRSSYFSMNLLVRAGKILLTGGWSQAEKWNKQVFQMLVMRSTISFPNDIGGKVPKICRSQMFPALSAVKKQFAGHVSEYLRKWLDWVYRCEDFTFHFTSSFVQM